MRHCFRKNWYSQRSGRIEVSQEAKEVRVNHCSSQNSVRGAPISVAQTHSIQGDVGTMVCPFKRIMEQWYNESCLKEDSWWCSTTSRSKRVAGDQPSLPLRTTNQLVASTACRCPCIYPRESRIQYFKNTPIDLYLLCHFLIMLC